MTVKNCPRIRPRIHEWMTQDSCIREKFVDGLWRMALLRELRSQTGEELDALLPSIPDKAFKGEICFCSED